MTSLAGLVTVALILLALASVIVADAWEAYQFRGRFPCGCKWPAEEDGPQVVMCAHGAWQFRPWKDWRGRVQDSWEETDEGKAR